MDDNTYSKMNDVKKENPLSFRFYQSAVHEEVLELSEEN
jgi:hypothetical protein